MKQNFLNRSRGLALVTVWFFVLLLASSAPHRVHHLFENLPSSQQNGKHAATPSDAAAYGHEQGHDHHGEHDSSEDSSDRSTRTDCVAQAVAQNSHLAPNESVQVAYVGLEIEAKSDLPITSHYHFIPSPFSQRAPPQA